MTAGQPAPIVCCLPPMPAPRPTPTHESLPTPTSPAAAASAAGDGLAGVRILIADDEDLLRGSMARHLGRLGADVAVAADGLAALAALRADRHDVLLLDGNMPHCNGAGVLADLRRAPLPYPLFIVLLSGGDLHAADGARYEDLGADLVVAKPARIRELAAQIATARARRRD